MATRNPKWMREQILDAAQRAHICEPDGDGVSLHALLSVDLDCTTDSLIAQAFEELLRMRRDSLIRFYYPIGSGLFVRLADAERRAGG